MGEEAVVTWFEVVFLHLPGKTEEQRWDLRKNSQLSGRGVNPTFRIRSKGCYVMDCDVLSFLSVCLWWRDFPWISAGTRMQYDANAGL
jgi:hypothetical protein